MGPRFYNLCFFPTPRALGFGEQLLLMCKRTSRNGQFSSTGLRSYYPFPQPISYGDVHLRKRSLIYVVLGVVWAYTHYSLVPDQAPASLT